ncbi:MAG: hypothetical protein WBJ45_04200 [Limnohabitans sp.]|uniref:hypothetical protein n=1 Tax=Limnohabitans sp. TaxID=1907725 RepID=UPI003BB1B44A
MEKTENLGRGLCCCGPALVFFQAHAGIASSGRYFRQSFAAIGIHQQKTDKVSHQLDGIKPQISVFNGHMLLAVGNVAMSLERSMKAGSDSSFR